MSKREGNPSGNPSLEEGAKVPQGGRREAGDFIDWPKVRRTETYRRHVLSVLRLELRRLVHSQNYWEREFAQGSPAGADGGDFRTKKELEVDADIASLRTTEQVREYVGRRGINIDVGEAVRSAERDYVRDQLGFEALGDRLALEVDEEGAFPDDVGREGRLQ